MVVFEDIIAIIRRDKNFEKLLRNAQELDTLVDLGFDSLDVMVVAHMINMEYKIEIEITSFNSFMDIANQVNERREVK